MIGTADGAMPGIRRIQIWADGARFVLQAANRGDTDRLRSALDRKLGPPDPACSTADIAHWRLEPGLSLAFTTLGYRGDGPVDIDLTLENGDPADVNCRDHAEPDAHPVSEAELRHFLDKVKADPPEIGKADAAMRWLSAFGPVGRTGGDCDVMMTVGAPLDGLPGFDRLSAEIRPCATGSGGLTSEITLRSDRRDMFAGDRLVKAATAVFGAPLSGCEFGTVWSLPGGLILQSFPTSGPLTLLLRERPANAACAGGTG